eukprot:3278265-Lingulodinium_polyedra.AAC.1
MALLPPHPPRACSNPSKYSPITVSSVLSASPNNASASFCCNPDPLGWPGSSRPLLSSFERP